MGKFNKGNAVHILKNEEVTKNQILYNKKRYWDILYSVCSNTLFPYT